jgi:WD40 repeat protein
VLGWGRVSELIWTPDGSLLVVGAKNGIYVYDAVSHDLLISWPTPVPVGRLALSPDGITIAAIVGAESDYVYSDLDRERLKEVYLWDTETGRSKGVFSLPMEGWTDIASIAFSPDGGTLALGVDDCRDCSVMLWDVDTGEPWANLGGHAATHAVTSLAFDPTGRWLASGDTSGRVVLWDLIAKRLQAQYDTHVYLIEQLAFSPDGRVLVATADKAFLLWAVEEDTLSLRDVWGKGYADVTFGVASHLLAQAAGTVEYWDPDTGEVVATLDETRGDVSIRASEIAWSPDGTVLALLDGAGISLWEPTTEALTSRVVVNRGGTRSAAFSLDGRLLVSAGWNGLVSLHDAQTLAELGYWQIDEMNNIRGLALSQNGSLMATWGDTAWIDVWNTPTGTHLRRLQLPGAGSTNNTRVSQAAFRPLPGGQEDDGRALALVSAGSDGGIRYWDVPPLLEVDSGDTLTVTDGTQIGYHTAAVTHLTFDAGGQWLVTADAQGGLHLWDAPTGRWRSRMPNPRQVLTTTTTSLRVTDLALSPDGATLAATLIIDEITCPPGARGCIPGGDGLVRLWDVTTRQVKLEWRTPHRLLQGLTWAPDAHWLATFGDSWSSFEDNTLAYLWDPRDGQELAVLTTDDGRWGIPQDLVASPGCLHAPDTPDTGCPSWLAVNLHSELHLWEVP